jgi:hypothetical protein
LGPSVSPRLTSFADAGAAAVAAGIATMVSDGSYVFHAPGQAPSSAPMPSVPVQRDPEDVPANANAAPAIALPAPASQAGPQQAAQAAPAAPAEQPPPLNLDQLAHQLYPKLRPYLRRELWVGRERSGTVTDRRSL